MILAAKGANYAILPPNSQLTIAPRSARKANTLGASVHQSRDQNSRCPSGLSPRHWAGNRRISSGAKPRVPHPTVGLTYDKTTGTAQHQAPFQSPAEPTGRLAGRHRTISQQTAFHQEHCLRTEPTDDPTKALPTFRRFWPSLASDGQNPNSAPPATGIPSVCPTHR